MRKFRDANEKFDEMTMLRDKSESHANLNARK